MQLYYLLEDGDILEQDDEIFNSATNTWRYRLDRMTDGVVYKKTIFPVRRKVSLEYLVKEKIMKIWDLFNGKKRYISIVMFFVAQLLKASGIPMPDNVEGLVNDILTWIADGFGFMAIIQAVVLKLTGKKNVS